MFDSSSRGKIVSAQTKSAHQICERLGDALTMNMGVAFCSALGFAAMAHMWAQFPSNNALSTRSNANYVVSAAFDDVGPLTVSSPVRMAGFKVGYVKAISLQPQSRKAVVELCLDTRFSNIPQDSTASIRTAGLLGGAYVGITPGAASAYLRSGSNMEMTESAFSLEHLMKGLSSLPGLQRR